MKKRIIAMVLVLASLLTLTACNKEEATNDPASSGNEQTQTMRGKYAFKPTYHSMQPEGADMQYISDFCVSGDNVFYYGDKVMGEEPWVDEATGETMLDESGNPYMNQVTETAVFKLDLSSGQVSELPSFALTRPPEGMLGRSFISGMFAGENGTVWIHEQINSYSYDLPEDFDSAVDNPYDYYVEGENRNVLRQLDADGKDLQTVELEVPESGYVYNLVMTGSGELVATDWQGVLFYDAQGKIKSAVEMESVNSITKLSDDRIVINLWKEDGNYLAEVDTTAMTLGEETKLETNVYTLYPGFDGYEYIYDNNGTFYGHTPSGEAEKLFSWIDCDVDSSNFFGIVEVLEDGRILTLESLYDNETMTNSYNLIVMEQVDPATVPVKQELTLACFYLDWELRSDIVEFNRNSDTVRIVVNDYSQYATDDDYEAGLQKLHTELMSGMLPDLFLLNGSMPVDQYAAKGFLMDLWPLIDGDGELSREDLMTHFFDALSIDGKLYQVISNFSIGTVAGKESVVGNRMSWTLQDLMQVMQQQPEGTTIFGNYDTKDSILDNCVARSADSFIDWNTLQCSFDSQEFIDMLTFANQFPLEIDYDNMTGDIDWMGMESEASMLRSGKQLLLRTSLYSFDSVSYVNRVFGEKPAFVGYPTMSDNGSCFEVGSGLAISSACRNVDAAWEFVRTYLTEEHQTSEYMYQFPTNRHAFEAMAKKAMTPTYETDPVTGEQVEVPRNYLWYSDDETVEIYAATQEEVDLFYEIYNNCTSFYSYNTEINELIDGETEAFFNGQKTAEETAKLIQDRVGLYVFENG